MRLNPRIQGAILGCLTLAVAPSLDAADGVLAVYFKTPHSWDVATVRVDPQVNLNPGSASPAPGVPTSKYSIRYQGYIIPKSSEVYTLTLSHNDGARLWLNGQLVIDKWSTVSSTANSTATIAMSLGTPVPFTVDYYHHDGSAKCQLYWKTPTTSKVLIPSTSFVAAVDAAPPTRPGTPMTSLVTDTVATLMWTPSADDVAIRQYEVYRDGVLVGTTPHAAYHDRGLTAERVYAYAVRAVDIQDNVSEMSEPVQVATTAVQPTGLTAVYYKNKVLNDVGTVRVDQQVRLDTGYTAPAPNLPNEDYSVCWQGDIVPTLSGNHTISVYHNDGIRLWINGVLSIDYWQTINGTRTSMCSVALTAGQPARIKLDYFQNDGQSKCYLSWEHRQLPKETIPAAFLRPMIDQAVPSTPALPVIDHVADRVAILSWPACSDDVAIAHYVIERDGQPVGTSPVPTFRDTWLTPSTAYQYVVRTVDVNGFSSPVSPTVTVTTAPAVIAGTGTGLRGVYFQDTELSGRVFTRTDPRVSFQWGHAAAAPTVPADDFSVCWEGWVEPFYTETYTFNLQFDNGVRLWVNDTVVAQSWGRQDKRGAWLGATMVTTGSVALQAGARAKIRLEYCDIGGPAEVDLRWESRSQPLETIPTSQLYPADAPEAVAVAVVTPVVSRTSPAWIEGTVGDWSAVVSARVGGDAVRVERYGATGWYASSTAAGSGVPQGVSLQPQNPAVVEVLSSDGVQSRSVNHTVSWQVTDLSNLDYGLTRLVVRAGDRLLVTAGGNGSTLQIDPTASDTAFTPAYTGVPGQAFEIPFPAGTYDVRARIDGVEVGRLSVIAYGVDFRGPIACETTYKRIKDVGISPLPSQADDVVFTSNDPFRLAVSLSKDNTDGKQLYLLPYFRGTPTVQARLGSSSGPIIAQCDIDEFRIWTTAEKAVGVERLYPDGSALVTAYMWQDPLIWDLTIKMRIFISGAVFENGTINHTIYTNDFQPVDDKGKHLYKIHRGAGVNPLSCHTIHVYQQGVLCSWP